MGTSVLFKWKDAFSVNNADIDEQHKRLLDLGNQVYELINTPSEIDNFDSIIAILKELTEYTSYHFKKEEDLLKSLNYDSAELEVHILQHKEFVDRISSIDLSRVDEDQTAFLNRALTFIADWITKHILQTDKKYSHLFQ